jgi:beta-fructofuranosidase
MSLTLPDKWIWDTWFAFEGENHHMFYLHASRALGDPNRRHRNVMVGHAVSPDLTSWTVVRDALAVGDSPAFDSYTTWTGSVTRDDDGTWWMFYTGTSRETKGDVQTIGAATSKDLLVWDKLESNPIVQVDERWYETIRSEGADSEACRDPWVFRFPNDPTWHMLFTARANLGNFRGVAGHATSPDLLNWTVQAPLSQPDQGFNELEVFQFAQVDGVPLLIFCVGWTHLTDARLAALGPRNLTYSVVVDEKLESIDFTKAKPFTAHNVYAGRLVQGKEGRWNLLGFRDFIEGEFYGDITDPFPVTANQTEGLIPR